MKNHKRSNKISGVAAVDIVMKCKDNQIISSNDMKRAIDGRAYHIGHLCLFYNGLKDKTFYFTMGESGSILDDIDRRKMKRLFLKSLKNKASTGKAGVYIKRFRIIYSCLES